MRPTLGRASNLRGSLRACVVAASIVWASGASVALADDAEVRKACVAAYERAQELRRDAALVEARDALVACSQPRCPRATKTDCVPWLAEVEAAMPTVVFEVRDASGRDRTDVRVEVDGRPLAFSLDGKAVEIDPGVHALRLSASSGEVVDERVTVRQGEKNRRIGVTFGAPAAPPKTDPDGTPGVSVPTLSWVAGGIGVAGLATFAVLAVVTVGDEDDLRTTCAPRCPASDVEAIRTKQIVADVGLGVGVVAIGAAVALYLLQPAPTSAGSARRAPLRFDLAPVAGGAAASLRGSL